MWWILRGSLLFFCMHHWKFGSLGTRLCKYIVYVISVGLGMWFVYFSIALFRITILGTGAKWLAALEDRNVHPAETHKLSTLHTILSTGSPLKPQSYDYVYSKIKNNVLLGSITGTFVVDRVHAHLSRCLGSSLLSFCSKTFTFHMFQTFRPVGSSPVDKTWLTGRKVWNIWNFCYESSTMNSPKHLKLSSEPAWYLSCLKMSWRILSLQK